MAFITRLPGLRPKTPNDRIGHSNPTLEKMGYIPTMPYIRLIPAVIISCLVPLVALGQAPSPPQAPAATLPFIPTAENQLDAATIKVASMERIAARIDQDVDMLNQTFKLQGNYYKDKGHKLRLQLKLIGLGETGSTLLQVCDGNVLWDYQQVLKMQIYRKRDILPILKKLEDPVIDPFLKSLVISQLGFGGPEAMMSGLRRTVKFDQVSDDKLDIDGTMVEVWVLGGSWSDRSKLLGPGDRPIGPTTPLPPYIPSNVRIFVGKVDGWPYKIEMIGNVSSMLQEDNRARDPATGRPLGVKKPPPKVDPSKVTLHYRLTSLSEINAGLFVFQPPADVPASSVKDETEEFLAQLDTLIQNETIRRKAEAAKAEGAPLLKAPPIEVKPNPGADAIPNIPPEPPLPK